MQSITGDALHRQDGATVTTEPQVPRPRVWTDSPEAVYQQLFGATEGTVIPDHEPPAPRSEKNRRRLRIAAVLALLLVLAAAGGAYAYSVQARKQPAVDALRAGNAEYQPVATKLRSASGIEELRTAAGRADAAAGRIEEAARPVASPSSELERRVREVLRDEAAVLRATAGVGTLEIESLGGWPGVRDDIADAESRLGAAVKRLAAVEPDLAPSLLTGRALASHSDDVVGDFASTSMTELLVSRVAELVEARTTADLRAIATRTRSAGEVVTLALKGVAADGPQGRQITAVGNAIKALSGLDAVTPDRLTAWAGVRAQLVGATSGLETVDTRNALSAVDGLVARAQQQLAAWRATTAKQTARNEKDARALTTYATAVRAALTSQVAADRADAAFVAGVGKSPQLTSQQAIGYLDRAKKTRATVATALAAAKPPKALGQQQQALAAVVDRGTATIAAAYQGTKKTRCGKIPPTVPGGKPTPAPCLYNQTGGWTAFSTGTAQAPEVLAEVRTSWDQALAAAQKAIADRKLPPKPVV